MMQPGDLVYEKLRPAEQSLDAIPPSSVVLGGGSMPLGIIIGRTKSNASAWIGNPHALQAAQGNPDLYYVFYSDGRLEGPIFGDDLVFAG